MSYIFASQRLNKVGLQRPRIKYLILIKYVSQSAILPVSFPSIFQAVFELEEPVKTHLSGRVNPLSVKV